MLAELTTKPAAAWYILGFVIFGILCSATRIWWIWWTEGTCSCGNAPRECKCHSAL